MNDVVNLRNTVSNDYSYFFFSSLVNNSRAKKKKKKKNLASTRKLKVKRVLLRKRQRDRYVKTNKIRVGNYYNFSHGKRFARNISTKIYLF